MGAGGDLNHAAVKAVCDKLECSPSQHDATGFNGGKPNIEPTAKGSKAANGKTTLSTNTSEFQMRDRSATLPNYKKRFAPKPQHI